MSWTDLREEIRRTAQNAVVNLHEADLLPGVDCKVDEYGEQVMDWSKFWSDGIVKEAEAIIYQAIKDSVEGRT